jgi:NAD(P)-dependent dehydrogenase (short-subunit alcohol dehydrogenase family)
MSQVTRGTAIITGAGSGIGAATARRLSADGFAIVLVGRDPQKLQNVGKNLVTPHVTVAVDLNGPESPAKIAAAIDAQELGGQPLQALINNAAAFHRLSFAESNDAVWREQLETNVMAPVRLIRACLPRMGESGVIINVSSTLGLRPIANTIAYSASKAALNNLTQGLALELAPRIRVCGVCPGIVDTPIHPFHVDQAGSERRRGAEAAQPMKRMGTPEEIAAMVSFLAGQEATWVTGSLHVVDGGISLL